VKIWFVNKVNIQGGCWGGGKKIKWERFGLGVVGWWVVGGGFFWYWGGGGRLGVFGFCVFVKKWRVHISRISAGVTGGGGG